MNRPIGINQQTHHHRHEADFGWWFAVVFLVQAEVMLVDERRACGGE
jgi:hypothetical protein